MSKAEKPHTTRRALFAGAIGLAAMTAPAIVIAAPQTDHHLLKMGAEWEALVQRQQELHEAWERETDAAIASAPEPLEAAKRQGRDWMIGLRGEGSHYEGHDLDDIVRVRDGCRGVYEKFGFNKAFLDRTEEVLAAVRLNADARNSHWEKFDCDDLYERGDETRIALRELRTEILQTRAVSIAGLAVKARAAAHTMNRERLSEGLSSLTADLTKLAEAA